MKPKALYYPEQYPRYFYEYLANETRIFTSELSLSIRRLHEEMQDQSNVNIIRDICKLMISRLEITSPKRIMTEKFIRDVRTKILSARNTDERSILIRNLCDILVDKIISDDWKLHVVKFCQKSIFNKVLIFVIIYHMRRFLSENSEI